MQLQSETQIRPDEHGNFKFDEESLKFYLDGKIIGAMMSEKGQEIMHQKLTEIALDNSIKVATEINKATQNDVDELNSQIKKCEDEYTSTYASLRKTSALCNGMVKGPIIKLHHTLDGMLKKQLAVYDEFAKLNATIGATELPQLMRNDVDVIKYSKENSFSPIAFLPGSFTTVTTEAFDKAKQDYEEAHAVWANTKNALDEGVSEEITNKAYSQLKNSDLDSAKKDLAQVESRLNTDYNSLLSISGGIFDLVFPNNSLADIEKK